MKLLDLMTGPWAILPEQLLELQAIYATHMRGEKIDLGAVEASLGRPLASDMQDYTVEPGGVGKLVVSGVMAPKANMFMRISGGVSTQMLAKQFDSMAADPRVRSACIAWDSPGGNVLAVPQAAESLKALAAAKPTVSVSENTMASAAYWVGSAAGSLFVSGGTDMVGSLGVISRIAWDKADPNSMELVRGKYKRASSNGNPPSAEVVAYHEAQIDHLYTLLINAVADNRGTSAENVLARMADGRVFIGQQAIDAGLVDGVSTVDAMVEKLATNPAAYASRRKAVFALGALGAPTAQAESTAQSQGETESASAGAAPKDDPTLTVKGNVMPQADNTPVTRESLERDHAALFASLRTEFMAAGAAGEQARIQAVQAQGALLPGHAALVAALSADGKTTGPEAAMALLAAEAKARGNAAQAHAADAPNPVPASTAPEASGVTLTKAEQTEQARAYAAENGISFVAALKKLGFSA